MMIAIVIGSLLIVTISPNLRQVIGIGKAAKAANMQDELNNWYRNWTTNGGIHNSTTTDAAAMAYYLITSVATAATTDAGISQGTGSNWVDETKMMVSGRSIPATFRVQIDKTVAMSGSNCVIDGEYTVTFTPTSSNTGAFTVSPPSS